MVEHFYATQSLSLTFDWKRFCAEVISDKQGFANEFDSVSIQLGY
jgi:hypothetical protein